MARLSVNLNKVALLRNSRHTGVPDLAHFARLALEAGAQGLTVHPRPDERHIRERTWRCWRRSWTTAGRRRSSISKAIRTNG